MWEKLYPVLPWLPFQGVLKVRVKEEKKSDILLQKSQRDH
jgi:hypothetical protein